jgi:hypothetical protein
VTRSEASIVGPDVRDQTMLRPPERVRDVEEFLEFLARLEEVFGPLGHPRPLTTGRRFLL